MVDYGLIFTAGFVASRFLKTCICISHQPEQCFLQPISTKLTFFLRHPVLLGHTDQSFHKDCLVLIPLQFQVWLQDFLECKHSLQELEQDWSYMNWIFWEPPTITCFLPVQCPYQAGLGEWEGDDTGGIRSGGTGSSPLQCARLWKYPLYSI